MNLENKTRAFYDKEARCYPLIHSRPVQRYSAAFEAELMRPYLGSDDMCLDVGCGEGRTARALAQEDARTVIGLDFSVRMLRVARQITDHPVVHYCTGDAMCLPFSANQFDVVVAVTSLNNVPDLEISLHEISRVLKPGGKALMLIINKRELAAFFRILYYFPYYLWRWLRGGSKKYRSLTFTRAEVLRALPPELSVVHVQGMRMLPDLLPEWPFNFYRLFGPVLSWLLNRMAPADRWLCAHPRFGHFTRMHFVAAIKR